MDIAIDINGEGKILLGFAKSEKPYNEMKNKFEALAIIN